MRTVMRWGFLVVLAAAWPLPAFAQGGFEQVTGDAFTKAVPNDFYLEGNRIPVEKRNAVLLKTPQGARVVLALIDTAGYSSQIRQKYIGMVITEGKISLGGISVGVGSYGFGVENPKPGSGGEAKFKLYNQAGAKLGECAAPHDAGIKAPRPLAVDTAAGSAAKLELGRNTIEIK